MKKSSGRRHYRVAQHAIPKHIINNRPSVKKAKKRKRKFKVMLLLGALVLVKGFTVGYVLGNKKDN